jgi:hypothetical protein
MRTRDRALAVSLAALALAALGALPASAQPLPAPPPAAGPAPAPPPPQAAVELRSRARIALGSGDVAVACSLFEQSYQAAKAPGSGVSPEDALFDLASCHEKQAQSAAAAAEFEQIAGGGGPRAAEAKSRAAALRAAPSLPLAPDAGLLPRVPGSHTEAADSALPREEPPTRLGDFMDTRLSWTFSDDDVIHQSGETTIVSPNFSIGDRKQLRLFFDNLNSRFGGRENLTHLALYKKMPGFIKNLDTEASLVLRFDIAELSSKSGDLNRAFYDAGSFIRAFYHTSGGQDGKSGLGITFWPIDTDRFRLGHLYEISWGGTNASINESIFPRIVGAAPGAKVQFDGDDWNAYVGLKTATIVQAELTLIPGTSEVETTRIRETNFGLLFGGSADVTENIHFDLGGGYFQQGKFDLPGVVGEPIYTTGGSARVVVHSKDMPLGQSVDFLLYRNDPDKPMIIFKPEVYTPGKTTFSASLEFSALGQRLKDFDASDKARLQPALAGALQANVKSGYLRASVTGLYRDLPFILRNQPSFIPFETLPKAAATSNEIFFAVAMDYHFPSIRLTPGFGAGLQFPATFSSISINSASGPIKRTVVVRKQGDLSILPLNQGGVPIFQARASLKWDLSRILSAIVWAQLTRDNDGTFTAPNPTDGTLVLRKFVRPNFFGLGTSVQARF